MPEAPSLRVKLWWCAEHNLLNCPREHPDGVKKIFPDNPTQLDRIEARIAELASELREARK